MSDIDPRPMIKRIAGVYAMNSDKMREYLISLNNMPLFDIYLDAGEVEAVFRQRKSWNSILGDEEIEIRKFFEKLDKLPEENDEFWSLNALEELDWQALRRQAQELYALLDRPITTHSS